MMMSLFGDEFIVTSSLCDKLISSLFFLGGDVTVTSSPCDDSDGVGGKVCDEFTM